MRERAGIEPLEGRIAPATLVSATVVSFTDLDGDAVTITFSEPLFDPAKSIAENRLNEVFKFSNGTAAVNFESAGPQQLQLIDLTRVQSVVVDGGLSNPASGTSVVVRAVKSAGGLGDDLTNVGAIEAAGLPLGTVRIDGDLGQIDAGRPQSKVAIALLAVDTLGKFGASTQVAGTAPADALESRITGKIRAVTVNGDIFSYLHAVDGTGIVGGTPTTTAPAKLGTVTVSGSLRGNPAAEAASNHTGTIEVAGVIRAISVLGTGDAAGLSGGGGLRSGSIIAEKLGTVNISGALMGGAGSESGAIISQGDLAALMIGTGLKGGAGAGSGSVTVERALPLATISGGILGGAGENSGVLSSGAAMGAVIVNGEIAGAGLNSGGISAGGDLASVVLNGNLTGGAGTHSGFIEGLKSVGSTRITGDVTGGLGTSSGTIVSGGNFERLVVKGRLAGDQGANSGSIFAGTDPFSIGTLAFVKVKGGIAGGDALNSGSIIGEGALGAVVIGSAASAANLAGGGGNFSGTIWASEAIQSVTIKGAVAGGAGLSSGSIHAGEDLSSVNIAGALTGGTGDLSGAVMGGRLAALSVGGGLNAAEIHARDDLGVALITGDVVDSLITARGSRLDGPLDLAIGRFRVSGDVTGSQILAGYDVNGVPANADASIGRVKVGGDWRASDLVSGVDDTAGNGFGNADDAAIPSEDSAARISQIAAVVIKGAIAGSAAVDDHFGFVAQQILAFRHGSTTLALDPLVSGQTFELGATGDVTVREVSVT